MRYARGSGTVVRLLGVLTARTDRVENADRPPWRPRPNCVRASRRSTRSRGQLVGTIASSATTPVTGSSATSEGAARLRRSRREPSWTPGHAREDRSRGGHVRSRPRSCHGARVRDHDDGALRRESGGGERGDRSRRCHGALNLGRRRRPHFVPSVRAGWRHLPNRV